MLKLAPNEDKPLLLRRRCGGRTAGGHPAGYALYVFNETARFRRCVMDKFVAEYGAGRTPNPIDCNRELKFGALLDRALTLGYDYIATGHYARVDFDAASGKYRLLRGAERRKDQSYVLYQLTQRQLAHLLLPVGDYDKPAIRDKARQAGLDNADKGDSQDICFVPDGDYVGFLRREGLPLTPGDFVDRDGRVLGAAQGASLLHLRPAEGAGRSRREACVRPVQKWCGQHHPAGRRRGTVRLLPAGLPCELDQRRDARQPVRCAAKTRTARRRRPAPPIPCRTAGCGWCSTSPSVPSRRDRPWCCTTETWCWAAAPSKKKRITEGVLFSLIGSSLF